MMKSTLELRKEKGILVAAHRGTSGGNIPPNTIATIIFIPISPAVVVKGRG